MIGQVIGRIAGSKVYDPAVASAKKAAAQHRAAHETVGPAYTKADFKLAADLARTQAATRSDPVGNVKLARTEQIRRMLVPDEAPPVSASTARGSDNGAAQASREQEFKEFASFSGTTSNAGFTNHLIGSIGQHGGKAIIGNAYRLVEAKYEGDPIEHMAVAAEYAFGLNPESIASFASYVEDYATSDNAEYQAVADEFASRLRTKAAERSALVATLSMGVPSAAPRTTSARPAVQHYVTAYDPGFLGINNARSAAAERRINAVVMREAAYDSFGRVDFSWSGLGNAGLGTLQFAGGYLEYLSSPLTGTLDALQGGKFVSAADRADTDFVMLAAGVMGGRTAVTGTARSSASTSIESIYRTRYINAYERGTTFVDGELAAGRLINTTKQPDHLFRANEIDRLARDDLRIFAASRGDGMDVVRINRRLYLDGNSGPYRIPDVHFPQSGTILDGTLGVKTARTPQVRDFLVANNNAPVGIVRPQQYGGPYWIGN